VRTYVYIWRPDDLLRPYTAHVRPTITLIYVQRTPPGQITKRRIPAYSWTGTTLVDRPFRVRIGFEVILFPSYGTSNAYSYGERRVPNARSKPIRKHENVLSHYSIGRIDLIPPPPVYVPPTLFRLWNRRDTYAHGPPPPDNVVKQRRQTIRILRRLDKPYCERSNGRTITVSDSDYPWSYHRDQSDSGKNLVSLRLRYDITRVTTTRLILKLI